jgi:RNA polymerase sigma factor (sigma-70 family)
MFHRYQHKINEVKLRRAITDPSSYKVIDTDLLPNGMYEVDSEKELMALKYEPDFIEELDKKAAYKVLYEILDTLREREKKILLCRFIDGLTLKETGKKHHITSERVRQIETKALRKMRHPNIHNILMNYFECFDFLESKEEVIAAREAERIKRELEHKEREKIWAAQERKRRKEREKKEKERSKQMEEKQRIREQYWNAQKDDERDRMAKYGYPYMPGSMLTPAHFVNEETERFVGKCSCSEWVKDWPVQFHRNQVYIDLFCSLCHTAFIMRSPRAYTPKEMNAYN